MKKVIVSTLNDSTNNYGAVFQACGLSNFLKEMGGDVYFISISMKNKSKNLKSYIRGIMIRLIMFSKHKAIRRRIKGFTEFIKETQQLIYYKTEAELFKLPPSADVFISGSDQVWNPVAMCDRLFLAYAPTAATKISYAASMGDEHIPEKNEVKFKNYIRSYEHVSVREDTCIPIIERYTDKIVHQHIDPVFLMTKDQWANLERPYLNLKYKEYILVYAIEYNGTFSEKLQDLRKKTGLPVVAINIGTINKVNADQVIYDLSPNEFLFLIRKASYVVASSFHGNALSLVFNKPFVPLVGYSLPTRIQSLLRHFSLCENDCQNLDNVKYERINKIIELDRKKAYQYFNDIFNQ